MKVLIIGAGPSGMIAGIKAAENGNQVIILEKNMVPGKKLDITGKGRCNISFVGDREYFLANVVTNPKFMMSSFSNFDNNFLIDFVNSLGVKTKEERGCRVFLASDDAHNLTVALVKRLKELKVEIKYNSKVCKILVEDKKVKGVVLENGKEIIADKVLVATGGKSYSYTGSTGDGYDLLSRLGHSITKIKPALVPLVLYEKDVCSSLQGVTLKNVTLRIKQGNEVLDSRFGELMFTNSGITGPIVLSSSSKINKIDNLDSLTKERKIKVFIDLKPAISNEELYKRITRDFEKYKNKEFKNSLNDLTISSLIPLIIKESKIDDKKVVNSITKEEKNSLVKIFKNIEFTLQGLERLDSGIVTSGGVDVKEINPKTMESKFIKGLYVSGELLDVDAYTGGFNLQIAFSTGYTAGMNMGENNE